MSVFPVSVSGGTFVFSDSMCVAFGAALDIF